MGNLRILVEPGVLDLNERADLRSRTKNRTRANVTEGPDGRGSSDLGIDHNGVGADVGALSIFAQVHHHGPAEVLAIPPRELEDAVGFARRVGPLEQRLHWLAPAAAAAASSTRVHTLRLVDPVT
jgi:hypothetical protein